MALTPEELIYCSHEDALAYLTRQPEGDQYANLTEDELLRAQADVNRQNLRCPGVHRDAETGLKLDVGELAGWQLRALSEAVADQAKFRRLFGERAMAMPQYDRVKGGGVERDGQVDKFSEEAYEKLVDAGLIPFLLSSTRAPRNDPYLSGGIWEPRGRGWW